MNKLQLKRLRTLSRILYEADRIPFFRSIFTMSKWGWGLTSEDSSDAPDCGTPACSMGHYAARTDVQNTFRLGSNGRINITKASKFSSNDLAIDEHFGLGAGDRSLLFGGSGCGDAKRPKQAAAFVERYADRMEKVHGLA